MLSVIEERAAKEIARFAETSAIFAVKIFNRKGRKETQSKTESGLLYCWSGASCSEISDFSAGFSPASMRDSRQSV